MNTYLSLQAEPAEAAHIDKKWEYTTQQQQKQDEKTNKNCNEDKNLPLTMNGSRAPVVRQIVSIVQQVMLVFMQISWTQNVKRCIMDLFYFTAHLKQNRARISPGLYM